MSDKAWEAEVWRYLEKSLAARRAQNASMRAVLGGGPVDPKSWKLTGTVLYRTGVAVVQGPRPFALPPGFTPEASWR